MSRPGFTFFVIMIWQAVVCLLWATWNMPDPRHVPPPTAVKGVPA